MPKFSAIVLAGGSGKRMGSEIPKQYMRLNGHPVLCYCLKAFEKSPVDEIILVVRDGDEAYCREEIIERYQIKKCRKIVSGGRERYDSVLSGLLCAEGDYVLIHDGARPYITTDIINNCIEALNNGVRALTTAIPCWL